MVITKFSVVFCRLLNKINPRSEEENIVIQYGFELILDNLIKLLLLQLAGAILGKGWETFIILFAFCILRLQAGGVHAKTNIGCSLGMIFIWVLSLIGNMFIKINAPFMAFLYVICVVVIACFAPRSRNLDYFTHSRKMEKKFKSILFLTLLMLVALFIIPLREIITFPVTLEVLSLLPKNKLSMKGD